MIVRALLLTQFLGFTLLITICHDLVLLIRNKSKVLKQLAAGFRPTSIIFIASPLPSLNEYTLTGRNIFWVKTFSWWFPSQPSSFQVLWVGTMICFDQPSPWVDISYKCLDEIGSFHPVALHQIPCLSNLIEIFSKHIAESHPICRSRAL